MQTGWPDQSNKAVTNDKVDFDRLWDFSCPDRSEVIFRELATSIRTTSSVDFSSLIEVLTQIARAQGLQGKISDAELTLKEAEALLVQINPLHLSAKIRFLLEKGRIFYLAKTPALARPLFLEAWSLASQSVEEFHAIDAAQMIAVIESPKNRIEWTLKALGLAENSLQQKTKQCLGPLYTVLGWHFYDLRQYEKSLDFFKKALERLDQELHASDQNPNIVKKIIVAKWSIGKTLRALDRFDDALKIQQELLGELERSGRKDGFVYEELAECLFILKRASEAEIYFELAYAELTKDEWLVDNKPERIKRLKSLGKVKGSH